VVSTTDKLELQQISSLSDTQSTQMPAGGSQTSLSNAADVSDVAAQASFYKSNLTSSELAILQQAVDAASDKEVMTLSGLFLNKRGVSISTASLQQLYALQQGKITTVGTQDLEDSKPQTFFAPTVSELGRLFKGLLHSDKQTSSSQAVTDDSSAESGNVQQLQSNSSMAGAIAAQVFAGSGQDAGQKNDQQSQRWLLELMNDADAIGNGVRYGTVPVLVDGKLIELELVMFQHRQADNGNEPIRRLTMSINTSTLGTVSITAEGLNNRLLVNISADSTDHVEALGGYASEVRELAARFGWNVDTLTYQVQSKSQTLARRVVEYVVRQGAIDHVW